MTAPVSSSPIENQDIEALSDVYAEAHRIQIRSFLQPDIATRLADCLNGLDWRLVLNDNSNHFDIHPVQQQALGRENLNLIKAGAKQRRKHQFQYLYENYPVLDLLEEGQEIPAPLAEVFHLFNSKDVRDLIKAVTGEAVDYCDMQATRFGPGHFLNRHDDGVQGKNRVFAYTLSLCDRWKPGWGGTLRFYGDEGKSTGEFVPGFNTLSLFRVPIPHEVMPVKAGAESSRLSLTGWFRTR